MKNTVKGIAIVLFLVACVWLSASYYLDSRSYVILKNSASARIELIEIRLGDNSYIVWDLDPGEARKVILVPTRESHIQLIFKNSLGQNTVHETETYFCPGAATHVETTILSLEAVKSITTKHEVTICSAFF